MTNCVLWISQNIPFQKELQELGSNIKLNFFSLPENLDCNENQIHLFLIEQNFFIQFPDFLKNKEVNPSSLLIWLSEPDKSYLALADKEKYVFDEIIHYEPTAFSRCLKNAYHSLWYEDRLKKTKEELQNSENKNKELLQVGIALSAEKDNTKLLQMILSITRKITKADAGSLYRVITNEETGNRTLLFKIAQNDSNPTDYTEFEMPLNKKSISGWVATTGEILNIGDVYDIPPDKEYSFSNIYDKKTNYRTKSMLTIPMLTHKAEIIGVIQLINRKRTNEKKLTCSDDIEKFVLPFTSENEEIIKSLASQAAVALENNLLYQEIETLFEGFVKASVKAIESRDPTTSGHSNRVAEYTISLARAVDRVDWGIYKNTTFSREQLKEIRYASLLHDFGKVGVREEVLVKAKKLYPIQMELIIDRFHFYIRSLQLELAQKKLDFMVKGQSNPNWEKQIENEYNLKIEQLKAYLQTIILANEPAILSEEPGMILDKIKEITFNDLDNNINFLLKEDEYNKLRIKKGSLDERERKEIESHVTHTFQFLSTIPWTREMHGIPQIAYGHHEKLSGNGYPRGISKEEIPVQCRMMTISDIYDALTARDRPYKKAVPMDKALQILQCEVADNNVDPELMKIFIEAKIWEKKDDLMEEK